MFSQVTDFAAECTAFGVVLDKAVDEYGPNVFALPTQFKQWTFNDILGHLHMWNWAADTSLNNPAHFQEFLELCVDAMKRGQSRQFERQWLKGLEGEALLAAWRDYTGELCERFAKVDPGTRVEWAGPSMSARSSITARLMETWSHAQAVYDKLGVTRSDEDRIKNIVVLGVNTYGWTFNNRSLSVPQPVPHLSLLAPSGATWCFNPASTHSICGSATEFCQVVTQVRHIDDTELEVRGKNALRWMEIAQCFAGQPETPPAPGSRCLATEPPRCW